MANKPRTPSKKKSPLAKKQKKATSSERPIKFPSSKSSSKKKKKASKSSSSLIKIFRLLGTCAALLIFFLWSGFHSLPPPIPSGDAPPLIFSNQCDDDLRTMYVQAIHEAKSSILLHMYSLSDSRIIRALKEKADAGVEVTVIHDSSTPQFGYKKLGTKVKCIERNASGLMHQKILVVDKEKIWLGSANFTTQSLRMDGNLVIALGSEALSQTIAERKPDHPRDFIVGGQHLEYWSLPEDKLEGLNRLMTLIETAQKTIRVAMFTWTHPELTGAVIRAHQRNVSVEVVMDAGQAQGVCEKSFKEMKKAGILVKTNQDSNLLHHKFALIDNKTLINGSANWTKAAFSKNDDCFLVLHDLNKEQAEKMEKVWHAIRATASRENAQFFEDVPHEPQQAA